MQSIYKATYINRLPLFQFRKLLIFKRLQAKKYKEVNLVAELKFCSSSPPARPLAAPRLLYIQTVISKAFSVDSSDIENTDDWLGCPTPLETCRHQLALYENEFEELNLQLRQARERIFKLVEMNDQLSAGKARLEAKFEKSTAEVARLQSERGELLGQVNSLLRVSDQRDHLFLENQRLLREARERQS